VDIPYFYDEIIPACHRTAPGKYFESFFGDLPSFFLRLLINASKSQNQGWSSRGQKSKNFRKCDPAFRLLKFPAERACFCKKANKQGARCPGMLDRSLLILPTLARETFFSLYLEPARNLGYFMPLDGFGGSCNLDSTGSPAWFF
jgi:hypothetical protein